MRILSFSSKPSPARTEKFPPPLLRFLRNNKSSRSRRGPSKASPLFFKKKRKSLPSSSGIEATQEPSSPKVTCIGQVRVRRSKNKSKAKNGSKRPPNPAKYTNYNLCCWSRKPRLCKLNSFTSNRKCDWKWRWRWIWRWICCDCCSVKVRSSGSSIDCSSARFDESEKPPAETREQRLKREFERRFLEDDNDDVFEKGRRSSTSDMTTAMSSISPPKNALLLTRSRSASLACRFWNEEEEEEDGNSRRNRCLEEEDISEIAKSTPNLTRCGSSSMAVRFGNEEEKKLKLMRILDEDDNVVHRTGRRSSTSDIERHSNEEDVYQIRRKSSASEMKNAAESVVNSRIFGCFGEDDSNQRRRKSSSSSSEMSIPTERVNSRVIGCFGEDDSNQTRRKSSASPKTAILLTRCKSSSLACRFWGEEGEEGRNTRRMEHFDEEGEFEVEGRRSCASEVGTSATAVGPPRNALLLMKCKASSLACRMWLDKRDSVSESRVSNFSEDSRKSVGVSDAAEVGAVEEQCGGDFDMIAVKNEGEFVNEDGRNEDSKIEEGKNEDGSLVGDREVKLRRCKSEPRRGILETFDSHRRSSNVN